MIDIKQKARELLVQAVGISIDYATDVDSDDALSAIEAALQQRVPTKWLPIETAPKDNERPLWIAQFNQDTGKLIALDWDASWEREQESWEIPQVYYIWRSANGSVEEPTHWAYQESDTPPLSVMQQREPDAVSALVEAAREALGTLDHIQHCDGNRALELIETEMPKDAYALRAALAPFNREGVK